MNTTLQKILDHHEPDFDSASNYLTNILKGPGYHTRVPNGTRIRETRANADYVLALLDSDQAVHHARAWTVLKNLLALQVTDTTAAHYGIWSWLVEESVHEMAPADWNWADFIGSRLAQILFRHRDRAPADVLVMLKNALRHAAYSIFRRNVGPGYTNIAIMGACVCMAAGELLSEPLLVEYGRRRLVVMVNHTQHHGSFNEYNSPTYTYVALEETERMLEVVHDAEARKSAVWLHAFAWNVIADHYHPGTGQWAGPHSRCYYDLLQASTVRRISERLGMALPMPHEDQNTPPTLDEWNVRAVPAPQSVKHRFDARYASPRFFREQFIRREPVERSVCGATWMNDDACFSSVSAEMLWKQRRPILGYFKTQTGPAFFRLRVLKDGHDFISAHLHNAQNGPCILSSLGFNVGSGDTDHPFFHKPPNGIFECHRLELVCEITAPADALGLRAEKISEQMYRIGVGDLGVNLFPGLSLFNGNSVPWSVDPAPPVGQQRVRAVMIDDQLTRFRVEELKDSVIALGLAWGAREMCEAPVTQKSGDDWCTHWQSKQLSVTTPQKAFTYVWA